MGRLSKRKLAVRALTRVQGRYIAKQMLGNANALLKLRISSFRNVFVFPGMNSDYHSNDGNADYSDCNVDYCDRYADYNEGNADSNCDNRNFDCNYGKDDPNDGIIDTKEGNADSNDGDVDFNRTFGKLMIAESNSETFLTAEDGLSSFASELCVTAEDGLSSVESESFITADDGLSHVTSGSFVTAESVIDGFMFSSLWEEKIKEFFNCTDLPYLIVTDKTLAQISRLLIQTCGSDEVIKSLCAKPDAEFSGRKLIMQNGIRRNGNPTRLPNLAGNAIGGQLQRLAGDPMSRNCKRRLYHVSSVTHILTSDPDDQVPHCDNHFADRGYF